MSRLFGCRFQKLPKLSVRKFWVKKYFPRCRRNFSVFFKKSLNFKNNNFSQFSEDLIAWEKIVKCIKQANKFSILVPYCFKYLFIFLISKHDHLYKLLQLKRNVIEVGAFQPENKKQVLIQIFISFRRKMINSNKEVIHFAVITKKGKHMLSS